MIGANLLRYEKVKKLKDTEFNRLWGIKRETCLEICQVVPAVENRKRSGRKSELSVAEKVLLTVRFWREYRRKFHIGQDWGIDESKVSRLVRKIKDILITCGKFSRLGKSRLLEENALH